MRDTPSGAQVRDSEGSVVRDNTVGYTFVSQKGSCQRMHQA
jgi:hypothetical protein